MRRQDSKGAAMFLFERQCPRKAKTASPACRKIPSGILPEGNPVLGKFFRPKKTCFVVAHLVGYLRANARVPPVSLPRVRLESGLFILKKWARFSQYSVCARQGLKAKLILPGKEISVGPKIRWLSLFPWA